MAEKSIWDVSWQRRNAVIYDAPVKIGKKYWFFYINAIYSYDETDGKVKKEQELSIKDGCFQSYGFIANIGRKIILSPFEDKNIIIYDTENHSQNVEVLEVRKENTSLYSHHIVTFEERAFVLPGGSDFDDILVLDNINNIKHIKINWEGKIRGHGGTSEYTIQDKYLWVTMCCSKQVLKLDMITEQYEFIEIGKDSVGYTGIVFDGEYIWLAESSTGAFVRYKADTGDTKKFDAPMALNYYSAERNHVHNSLFHFGKYIVSIPALCGEMTILDKETEKIDIINPDFFYEIMDTKTNYEYGQFFSSSFGKKIDEKTLWVQRTLDGEIACINMENLTYTTFSFKFDELEFHRIGARMYHSGITKFNESCLVPLESLICSMMDLKASTVEELGCNYGEEIWKKVK